MTKYFRNTELLYNFAHTQTFYHHIPPFYSQKNTNNPNRNATFFIKL